MTIESAFHTAWAGCKPLCDMIPAERLYTGRILGDFILPYALINREGTSQAFRASGASEGRTTFLRLDIYCAQNDLPTGQQAMDLAIALVNRREIQYFDVSSKALLWQLSGGPEQVFQPDGVWELSASFEVLIQHKEGVGANG